MTDATYFGKSAPVKEATGPERKKPKTPIFIGDALIPTPGGTVLLDVLREDQKDETGDGV